MEALDEIPIRRKELLNQLAGFVKEAVGKKQTVQLNFICTHNSRQSHISRLWAQAAGFYFGIPGVVCYSEGTEATAFNLRAARAMQRLVLIFKK